MVMCFRFRNQYKNIQTENQVLMLQLFLKAVIVFDCYKKEVLQWNICCKFSDIIISQSKE